MGALLEPLIDSYGRVHTSLRLSLTDRCNYRCRYCMPPEGIDWTPREQLLTFDEISRLTRIFVRLGVDKLRLTGGEPTLRVGLVDLIARLRDENTGDQFPLRPPRPSSATSPAGSAGEEQRNGLELAMTTNGHDLERMATKYREAGISAINISLDSLDPEVFEQITLRDECAIVLRGLNAALEAEFDKIKVNVVVMKGINDGEILDLVELTRNEPIQVRFIEFMPFDGNGWKAPSVFPYRQMVERIESKYALLPLPSPRGAVAKEFAIDGFKGTVGFITSMTDSFCSSCNRLRITADGNLKACLFGAEEVSLRDPMRQGATDYEIEDLIRAALWRKPEAHPPMQHLLRFENRSMIRIGG